MDIRKIVGATALLAGVLFVGHSVARAQVPNRFTLLAVLAGGNEVSATGEANAGDRNGYGSASVVIDPDGVLCYSIIVKDIAKPTAAHIHAGAPGTNGDIILELIPPAHGNPGTSSKCVHIGPTLVDFLLGIRGSFGASEGLYINVHNDAFPAGAVRGQLF